MNSPLPRHIGWLTAIVATLAMTVSYVDRQTLSALAPTVRTALNIDHTQYGWLTSAFSLSYLVGAPLAGWLLDRAGARRGLAVSVLVWSLVSAAHALVPSFAVLFVLRVALGAAEAPSFPGAAQTVRRVLPVGDRSMGYGLIFTGSSVGAMFAAPLAIWLKIHYGWQLAFVGTALVGLLWVPLWLLVTSTTETRAAMSTPDPATEPPLISESWFGLFTDPALLRCVVLVFVSAPGLMFVLNWYSQYLVDAQGVPQDALGRYLWLPPLLFDLGAVGFGALASRRERGGHGRRSHVGLVILSALLASSLSLVPLVHDPISAVILGGVAMAGGGGCYTLAASDMLRRVHPRLVSRAGGFSAASQSLAHIIAGPLIGMVLDRQHDYTSVLVALGMLVVPGAAAWIVWPLGGREPKPA